MNFNYYIYFSIAGLINLIFIMIIFFSKQRKYLFENNVYIGMMVCTLIGIVIELIMGFYVPVLENMPFLKVLIAKSFLIITEMWIYLLCIYTLLVSNNLLNIELKHIKKQIKFLTFIYFICAIITLILPIYYKYNSSGNSWLYTYGPSTKVVFISSIIFISISIYYIFKNKLFKRTTKYIPIYIYILLSIIVSILQQIIPNIIMISFVETLIILLMYHTIENPDVKLLEEIEFNKRIIEKNNEEKSNLLFKISQDVRIPIKEIENKSFDMLNMKNKKDFISVAKEINSESKSLSFIVDNVLNINSIDINNIKLYKTKFDIYKLCNEINLIINNKLPKPKVFNFNIYNNIPLLYGDEVRLKQIICSIINFCFNNKSKYVDLDISGLLRYDICRIIINIKDQGNEISLNKINDILCNSVDVDKDSLNDNDLNLDLENVYKIIKLLNGTFFIKTDKKGNTFSIIIDYEIVDKSLISIFSNIYSNKKKVLIINDNSDELKKYVKFLKKFNVDITTSMFGKDCVDRIKYGEKYDLIIIDDEMQPYNAIETYNELKKNKKFKTNVVIMLGLNKEFIKEHYIDNYKFSDYLIKRNYEKELKRLINKYF